MVGVARGPQAAPAASSSSTSVEIDGLRVERGTACATPEALADALRACDDAGSAVAPLGGGTHLDLGMPPSRLDVALDTTRLSRVIEYEPADLTLTVEAGLAFEAVQRLLGEQGQFLALDPPAQSGATIGGLIATNASGPIRFAYGTARDLVIGTRVANPDGTLTRAGGRVVKNVAGYDLNKLHVGALGTLGILVELSFKVSPIPPAAATIVGQLADVASARDLMGTVVRSPLSPLAIELLGPGAARAAGLSQPGAVLVVFRVGGYPQAVERQVRELSALIVSQGGTRVETADTAWEDLARMRLQAQQLPLVVKAAVPLAESSSVVQLLERHLVDAEPVVWSHAGNGIAFAACGSVPDALVLHALRREIGLLGSNASLVVQRCPTSLKREIDVWGDPGSSLPLMRAVKDQLDPKHTLNPGRYVGGL